MQYAAGHDNIETAMRMYTRVKLFAPPADLKQPEERIQCKKSVQNPVQSEMPAQDELLSY